VRYADYDAGEFGVGTIVRADDGLLLWHELPSNGARHRKDHGARHGKDHGARHGKDHGARHGKEGVNDPLADRLAAFFRGVADDFADVELDLSELTPFGRRMAEALRAVPRGEIVSYGELAALAGRPRAARAAGTFCAHNRYPILIPCHRVVSAHGLGGYGSLGAEYKRRLLALEHVAV
jgi:methylated-DNA-[protein]-cysteine S-methyltransferase